MTLIVKTSAENPYEKSLSYQKKSTATEVNYLDKIYYKQITYEKQINLCCRIIRVALCVLAAVTLIPLCVSASLISKWWNQAMSGVDQKVVLIKDRVQPPPSKNVPPSEVPKPFKRSRDVLKELFQKENDSTKNQALHKTPSSPAENGQKPRVRFRDARARLFDKEAAPARVTDVASVNLANLGSSSESHFSLHQQRKIPPLSINDAQTAGKNKLRTFSYFADEAIVGKAWLFSKRTYIGHNSYGNNDVCAFYTEHGKAIIQQQSMNGGPAAMAAMMSLDHGAKTDLEELLLGNVSGNEDMATALWNAGLNAITNTAYSYRQLRDLIVKHGSAIVSGRHDGPLSGHVFIVDDISKDFYKVRIRDPYHGWEITLTAEAFVNAWQGGQAIQIEGKK